jgi:hypothetical protein
MATLIGGYGPVGIADDGGIIPAEPDCQVPPDVPVGEILRPLRVVGRGREWIKKPLIRKADANLWPGWFGRFR